MRVVVWLSRTVGKGFPLPVVLAVGAVVGIGVAAGSFFAGRAAEKKKREEEERKRETKE